MTTHSNSPQKYQDLILRPEFQHLKLNFPHGITWIRILPGLGSSAYGWLLPILALEFPGGRFVHPASFDPNRRSAYDVARDWFLRHDPSSLCSKTNKTGFRLRPVRMCACWAVEFSETEIHSLRLVLESFSNGSTGPVGLAHKIWWKIVEKDENGERMGDAIHPTNGVMISVERHKRKGAAPLDWIRLGRIPRCVDEMLETVSPVEASALRPLEEVIYQPTVDEQWEYLGRLVTHELAARIRIWDRERQ
ncbi:MAG: hypothetical protein IAE94_06585 [Chthoniobacterales bacterium]|nr:hypothetical protein [Chthoniobacterales bacterium]